MSFSNVPFLKTFSSASLVSRPMRYHARMQLIASRLGHWSIRSLVSNSTYAVHMPIGLDLHQLHILDPRTIFSHSEGSSRKGRLDCSNASSIRLTISCREQRASPGDDLDTTTIETDVNNINQCQPEDQVDKDWLTVGDPDIKENTNYCYLIM